MFAALLAAWAMAPLLDDRPLADDLLRFPSYEVVQEQIDASWSYYHHLAARLVVERHQAWAIFSAMAEAEHLYNAWANLRDAHSYDVSVELRRDSLAALRDVIGPDDYYAGRMPPPVPLWRFVRLD